MQKRIEFLETIKNYNSNYDMELIARAYDVAEKMHRGQIRKSGEPYLIHPMAVAEILAQYGMDEESIAAGLLHDVVEDTSYSEETMIEQFGEDIALMVDGVTKLKLNDPPELVHHSTSCIALPLFFVLLDERDTLPLFFL